MTRIGPTPMGGAGSSDNHGHVNRTAPKLWHGRKITVLSRQRLLEGGVALPQTKASKRLKDVSAKRITKTSGKLTVRLPKIK